MENTFVIAKMAEDGMVFWTGSGWTWIRTDGKQYKTLRRALTMAKPMGAMTLNYSNWYAQSLSK